MTLTRGKRSMPLRSHVAVLALVLPSCFDVVHREPGSESELLLGDFEEERVLGPYPFERWKSFFFNPDTREREDTQPTARAPGHSGGFSLMVEVDFKPTSDGEPTGGGLGAFSLGSAADLRGYRSLEFYAKYETRGALQSPRRHYAQLGCLAARAENPNATPELFTVRIFEPTKEWKKFEYLLSDFDDPNWKPERIDGGPEACRAAVDSVRFAVDVRVAPTEDAAGVLHIDDVKLR
jgi:hypothetical protein